MHLAFSGLAAGTMLATLNHANAKPIECRQILYMIYRAARRVAEAAIVGNGVEFSLDMEIMYEFAVAAARLGC